MQSAFLQWFMVYLTSTLIMQTSSVKLKKVYFFTTRRLGKSNLEPPHRFVTNPASVNWMICNSKKGYKRKIGFTSKKYVNTSHLTPWTPLLGGKGSTPVSTSDQLPSFPVKTGIEMDSQAVFVYPDVHWKAAVDKNIEKKLSILHLKSLTDHPAGKHLCTTDLRMKYIPWNGV